MQISIVPVDYIETAWPQVQPYMEGAAEYTYGRYTAEDIKQGILTKPQQLWIAFDADNKILGAVVTEIVVYPRLRSLVMHFTGGVDLKSWKPDMLSMLQRFAKENGCDVIESYGREGWGKVFKNDGFKSRFMFYELPVEN
jgi:hypothetical protein